MEEFPKGSGWTWRPSIGLLWGTAPDGSMHAVARPLMTSPWWVFGETEGVDLVQIYPSPALAIEACVAAHEGGA